MLLFPSSSNMCASLFWGLLCLCAATLPMNAMGQTIVIHGDRDLGVSRLRQGFVHGIGYQKGTDYSRTIALISAVKPMSWRLSRHGNLYGFVVGEAKLPQTLGTELVFNIQDLFNIKYGYDVRVGLVCLPNQKNCFSSYDTFKKSWLEVLNAALRTGAEKNLIIDYIDVFAEPDYGQGKLGVTPEQLGDIFKSTHDTVRQYRPNAKIVAPSFSAFREVYLTRFLTFVADNNLRLDALSWHEFNAPELIPSHVSKIREFFKTQPKLCNPRCPEIHINEYSPDVQFYVPGNAVGWLYYLEKAGVDHANRACWDNPDSCWAGFGGLLMQDNVTPQPLYWVYRAYADMAGSRVATQSSSPQVVAIASKNDERQELRILAGNYNQKGTSGPVSIEVKGYQYDASSVIAEIRRVPDTGNKVQPLPSEPPATNLVVRVRDRAFSIVIGNFRDGEAYAIVVRPVGR